jgi:hypothetical protein
MVEFSLRWPDKPRINPKMEKHILQSVIVFYVNISRNKHRNKRPMKEGLHGNVEIATNLLMRADFGSVCRMKVEITEK